MNPYDVCPYTGCPDCGAPEERLTLCVVCSFDSVCPTHGCTTPDCDHCGTSYKINKEAK
jgi:hypothetical protein